MGGGDLNLKKSWHPHTMKNQEKVWKAEQAKNQEEQKLNDLRREIEEERNREELKRMGQASGVLEKNDDKKLEWMYKSSTDHINREDYLLGRQIDKSFEMLQEEEQRKNNQVGVKVPVNHVEHECIPFSIRSYKNLDSTEQVDLQRKVMEDPLMLIKQKELESRRKLLENPVKLKELHRLLKTEQEMKKMKDKVKKSKKAKKSKKSKKKHKKHKKKSSSDDSESESDSSSQSSKSGKDLDKELEKRYKKLKGTILNKGEDVNGLNLTKLLDAKYETISKELDKAVKHKDRSKKTRRSSTRSRSRSRDKEINRRRFERDNRRQYSSEERRHDNRDKRRFRSSSQSPVRQRHQEDSRRKNKRKNFRSRTRSRSQTPERKKHPSAHEIPRTTRSRSRTPKRNKHSSPQVQRTTSSTKISAQPTSKQISEEEKQKRIREMMENAAWRDEERTKIVHKHRQEYAKEEEQLLSRNFDKDFINKEVKKAISKQTSLEARIRSNLNNIQRTSSALNSNFTRK